MATRVLLISSTGVRHRYVADVLASEFDLAGILTEDKVEAAKPGSQTDDVLIRQHFADRDEAENRLLGDRPFPDVEVNRLARGQANSPEALAWINSLKPDVIVLFGSGIIAPPLLDAYKNRIINMHLGLSPYYRGSGTNFFPLVHGVPEYVGTTIHLAVPAVDAGPILSQVRPEIEAGDRCHHIGTKALMAGVDALAAAVPAYLAGRCNPQVQDLSGGKVVRRRDFNAEALRIMHANFAAGFIPAYLAEKVRRDQAAPICSFP